MMKTIYTVVYINSCPDFENEEPSVDVVCTTLKQVEKHIIENEAGGFHHDASCFQGKMKGKKMYVPVLERFTGEEIGNYIVQKWSIK